MPQRLVLDRPGGRLYYLLAVLPLAACGRLPPPVAPAGLPPLAPAVLEAWVARHRPARAVRYELGWTYETQKGSLRGRGAIRVAPPDSLRFDYRAPFGRSGAAVLVGDSVVWSAPEDEIEGLFRITPLFWAALGVAMPPAAGAVVTGREREGSRAWRYAMPEDTLTFAALPGVFRADMRRAGHLVGWVDAQLSHALGPPLRSVLLFPRAGARFAIEVRNVDTLELIDPEVWKKPQP